MGFPVTNQGLFWEVFLQPDVTESKKKIQGKNIISTPSVSQLMRFTEYFDQELYRDSYEASPTGMRRKYNAVLCLRKLLKGDF